MKLFAVLGVVTSDSEKKMLYVIAAKTKKHAEAIAQGFGMDLLLSTTAIGRPFPKTKEGVVYVP